MTARTIARTASALLVALFMLCLAWEWRLAPLRPEGSWLALKSLPLLAALPGVLRGRRYTYQWASLLILPYFAEGVVRTASDMGVSRTLAALEAALSLAFFACALAYARRTGTAAPAGPKPAD
jgi:uncharacterized membrane protein